MPVETVARPLRDPVKKRLFDDAGKEPDPCDNPKLPYEFFQSDSQDFIDKTSMGPAPVYFPPETAWYEMGPQRPKKDQEPWNLNKKCPLTVCFIYNFPGYTINKDGHREPKNETPIDPVPEFNAGGAEVAWNHI